MGNKFASTSYDEPIIPEKPKEHVIPEKPEEPVITLVKSNKISDISKYYSEKNARDNMISEYIKKQDLNQLKVIIEQYNLNNSTDIQDLINLAISCDNIKSFEWLRKINNDNDPSMAFASCIIYNAYKIAEHLNKTCKIQFSFLNFRYVVYESRKDNYSSEKLCWLIDLIHNSDEWNKYQEFVTNNFNTLSFDVLKYTACKNITYRQLYIKLKLIRQLYKDEIIEFINKDCTGIIMEYSYGIA
jgi:hypothetical protein